MGLAVALNYRPAPGDLMVGKIIVIYDPRSPSPKKPDANPAANTPAASTVAPLTEPHNSKNGKVSETHDTNSPANSGISAILSRRISDVVEVGAVRKQSNDLKTYTAEGHATVASEGTTRSSDTPSVTRVKNSSLAELSSAMAAAAYDQAQNSVADRANRTNFANEIS